MRKIYIIEDIACVYVFSFSKQKEDILEHSLAKCHTTLEHMPEEWLRRPL
jgi:hypothetical protein